MNASYPIVPSQSGTPQTRRNAGLARSQPVSPPVHEAGEMGLGGARLRQECWNSLGERTRARLHEHAGDVIEWYASEDESSGDGRCYAVLFGDRGLSIAEPRVSTDHRPVYAVSAFLFDPSSLRHVQIDHRPPPRAPRSPAPPKGPAEPVKDIGLTAAARGIVGNLPPRAQELLQAPFLTGQQLLRCSWAYEGFEHRLDMFMFYLAGPRDVTVAAGTKVVPAGHTDATAHWALTCYRASVVKRIGK